MIRTDLSCDNSSSVSWNSLGERVRQTHASRGDSFLEYWSGRISGRSWGMVLAFRGNGLSRSVRVYSCIFLLRSSSNQDAFMIQSASFELP